MCTLTYIPKQDVGFILTSNRDESIFRLPALPPTIYLHNGVSVMYPKDTQAGGTWVAVSENRFTLCLLNGAFVKHKHEPPYKHSRGLVVTDFFNYNDVAVFLKEYDFSGLEPFTLVIIESATECSIHEIRWDGQAHFYATKDLGHPQIWSSASMYEDEVVLEREKWFNHFLESNPDPTTDDMLQFHHFGGGHDENRLLMNRNNILKTISITGITHYLTRATVHHENLLTGELSVSIIEIK
jgi:hypothetical protein